MRYKGKFRPQNREKYKGNSSNIVYRSGWELNFMKYLDRQPEVLQWNSEVLRNYLEKKGPLKDTVDLILSADVIHKLRNMDDNHPEVKHSMDLNVK